jgi:selenocysteine lyase/cysteine desulfurase
MPGPRADAFSLPEGLHYLNCAYMSPQPRQVEAAGLAALVRKRDPTSIHPSDFFETSDRVRSLFARLIGADEPSRVALVPAASYALSIAARHLVGPRTRSRGSNIVLAAEQFPSNAHVWRTRGRRFGAEVRSVAAPEEGDRGAGWNRRILEAIDSSTSVVALGHVHWTDGTLFRLPEIGARAREVGAALVIDGTQSVGALPFDVSEIRPDLLVCAGYKWLLGPYSTGVAYFGPRFDHAEPLEETWLGREGSDDFRRLTEYRDEYRVGAARFDVGERSNFVLLPMLATALELILEWEVSSIQRYCRELTRRLVAEARDLGYGVEDEEWRGAHLFGIRARGTADQSRLEAELRERRVSVSLRGDAIRVSPHLYNGDEDVEALLDALRAAGR